jgi:hypothetical protein
VQHIKIDLVLPAIEEFYLLKQKGSYTRYESGGCWGEYSDALP